jgi:peptide/nickel transport system substrate-binding protein
MRNWKTLLASVVVASSLGIGSAAFAQDAEPAAPPITDFPRNETLIINNPEQPAANPPWFNIWLRARAGAGRTVCTNWRWTRSWFIDRRGPQRLDLQRTRRRCAGI